MSGRDDGSNNESYADAMPILPHTRMSRAERSSNRPTLGWAVKCAGTAVCIVAAVGAASAEDASAVASSRGMTTAIAESSIAQSSNMQPLSDAPVPSSQSKRMHSHAVLHATQLQQAANQDSSDPPAPPLLSRLASLFSSWFGKGADAGMQSEQRSAAAAVASSELDVLPSFSHHAHASTRSSSADLTLTQSEVAMWLHEHRHEHPNWSQMSFLPPQWPTAASAALFSQPPLRREQLRSASTVARSTAHRRSPRVAPHSPRAFSRQDHPPVLPPIASSDDTEASAALLNLNDDDHMEVNAAHVAEDAQTELLLKALALQVAELESNSSTIDVAGSTVYFPSNISSVYRGAWNAEPEQEDHAFWTRLGFPRSLSSPHKLTRPAGFESEEGVLMFILRAFPTWRPPPLGDAFYSAHPPILPSTARFSYVEGEMVLRDGHYASRNDRIFLLHGLYSSHDGLVRLFSNHDELRATTTKEETEEPFWLSRTNLQQYLLNEAEQNSPTLAQQVFLTELSYELNRTRTEVQALHRQRDRDRYRQMHGEDRAVTILRLRQHQHMRHGLMPMSPEEAEVEAQAEMDAEDAAERMAKRYSKCEIAMVFQLAPLQGTTPPDATALYAVQDEAPDASSASSANSTPAAKPLSMRPISFAVDSPRPPPQSSPSRPQSPSLPVTSPILASSAPSVGSSASADDALTQRRLQVIERAVQQHQDEIHAAASAQVQSKGNRHTGGIGLSDASHVNEASTQPQRSHLAMDGFLFSNQTCSPVAAAPSSGVAASECEACNFKLRLHATILEIQPFFSKALHYAYFQSAIAIAQLYLTHRQMGLATTAVLQRVSPHTIVVQALSDNAFFVLHLGTAWTFDPLFNAFIVTASLQCILCFVFEIRWINLIWAAIHPAEAGNVIQRQQSMRRIYIAFYASFFAMTLLVWMVPSALLPLIFFLNSLWIPQIGLQAYLGVRRALKDEYINGTSLLRLLPAIYLFGCPSNITGHHQTSLIMPFALITWMIIQLLILHSQKRWGARWFVSARCAKFLPERYDYFREIPLSVLGPKMGRRGGGGRGAPNASAAASVAASSSVAAGARLPALPVAVPVSSVELSSLPSHSSSALHSEKSLEERALNAVQLAMDSNGDASPAADDAAMSHAASSSSSSSSSSSAAAAATFSDVSIDVHPGSSSSSSSAPIAAASAASIDDDEDDNPCPICYGELELDLSSGASSSPALMLCPCDHLYHAVCLRRWMEQQMKCPVCRSDLPVEEDMAADEEEQQSEAHEAQGLLHQPAHANV